jgi:phage shock protein C
MPLGAVLKEPNEPQPGEQRPGGGTNGEFAAAMARLEKAVGEIVKVTTGQLSERATTLLDDTSQRLEAELRLKRASDTNPDIEQEQQRRSQRRYSRHRLVDRAERVNPRSGRLYRDPEHQKIAGVCAGVARYFGVDRWIVRLAALTGLLFMPAVVMPAYWIAYFLMDTPAKSEAAVNAQEQTKNRGRKSRRGSVNNSSDAESNQPFQPSRSLRYTSADLTQAELRLRRLESFVTSDQYELHKELTKIEREAEQPNAS